MLNHPKHIDALKRTAAHYVMHHWALRAVYA